MSFLFHAHVCIAQIYTQGGAVFMDGPGSKGTFENCNFTSNVSFLFHHVLEYSHNNDNVSHIIFFDLFFYFVCSGFFFSLVEAEEQCLLEASQKAPF